MMEVIVHDGDIDTAIRFLKRVVAKDGIHQAIKRREANAKPSMRRKEKERVAERRRLKLEQRRNHGPKR